ICGGLSTNSTSIYMVDTPFASGARGKQIHICTGVDDTLHLLQPYGGANITYQWQVAPWIFDPFVDIPGGTNDTFLVSATQYSGNNYFRCVQTCTSNGAASNSAWVNEIENPNPLCYCMPYNGNPCTNQYYISNVSITSTTLNHSATCIDTIFISFNRYNYQFFNPAIGNTTAILGNGNTYTLNVNTDSLGQRFAMWLDYNGDGNFAPNEWTNGVWVNPGTPGQVQFTVPVNAAQGATGMRIRSTLNWTYDSTMACSIMTGGSTYDYIVTIDSTVGIADLGIEIGELRLMPNPSKDNLTITALNFTPTHNAQFIITDLTGRILQQEIFTGTATINTTALTPAVYFVTVKDKERSVVRRFVKAP
ncbi:MAG TPA: T9SS type A sorting domain-containing protein, partial [Bacteroidia bacterium]|nr:T9SS type A sorting domain-containing protein [Bacteroidia bacterium]